MIRADESAKVKTYLVSLGASPTPKQFAAGAMPVIERDRRHSFGVHVQAAALSDPSQ